jgi:hypothetical protein
VRAGLRGMNRSGIAERRLHCVAIGLDYIRKRGAPRGFQVRYHDHDHAPVRWGPRHEDPFGRAFDHPQALHGRVIGLDGPTLHVTRVCPRTRSAEFPEAQPLVRRWV